jgi:glycosyltransferase involved in cell wall biosynthesis
MNREPLVSVVVSTYNRYERLMQALCSVERQTYRNLELIVVNDGSSDPRYRDAPRPPDATWIDLPRNTRVTHGFPCLGHVRNVGIARARGEYLAFLDDDDTWLPGKIERQIAEIHGSGFGMCCTEVFATDGAPADDLEYPRYYRDMLGLALPSELTLEHLGEKNLITHSSVVLHRAIFDQAGPYPEVPLQGRVEGGRRVVEDWELWRSCLRYTSCRYIAEPLVHYDCKYGKLRRPYHRARLAAARTLRALLGLRGKIPAGY